MQLFESAIVSRRPPGRSYRASKVRSRMGSCLNQSTLRSKLSQRVLIEQRRRGGSPMDSICSPYTSTRIRVRKAAED
jgi:hypothetical protein